MIEKKADARKNKSPELRSRAWYGKKDKDGFIHRSWMKMQGYTKDAFEGKPVIGICNTWSEFNPCNSHLRSIAEAVKRGVWEAGALPLEFPVMSLGETQMRPTAMLFRNLLSMDCEESIRANGMDGVVLLGGCDKTTPGQLMGAASVDLPSLVVSSGPMLSGKWRGKSIGSGTDVWKLSEATRRGEISKKEFMEAEASMSRSPGVCNTMGTASTMANLIEAMGLCLPMNSVYPAMDARRLALAQESGRRIVAMVREDVRLSKVLSKESFQNAATVCAAIGGSSNAVVHLLAIAGRLGIDFRLKDFQEAASIPLLLNCMPAGEYLMEDYCYAGGLAVVLNELKNFLKPAKNILAKPMSAYYQEAQCFNTEVIYRLSKPLKRKAGIHVLYGNLAPNGAVIKPAAASAALLEHEGEAYVFETVEEMKAKIDDEDLPVDANSILVLKNCGPKGYPGMAEVANMPIPKKLLKQGVRDMIRICDGRMSGTAFGTVVLHVSPESYVGGPLAYVQTGDRIQLSLKEAKIEHKISEKERTRRKAKWKASPHDFQRGYYKLFLDHVLQAEKGVDFDFLLGKSSSAVLRESH